VRPCNSSRYSVVNIGILRKYLSLGDINKPTWKEFDTDKRKRAAKIS